MNIDSQINQMIQTLDQEMDYEAEIKEKAKWLTTQLTIQPKQRVFIKGKEYTVSYKRNELQGQIVLIDHTRLAIAGNKYMPAVFDAVFDKEFSEFENLNRLIETVYYYKYDLIQSEDMVEEEDSVWQIQKNN